MEAVGPAFTISWSQALPLCRVSSHSLVPSVLPIQAGSRPGGVGERRPAERQHQVQRAPSGLGAPRPRVGVCHLPGKVRVEQGARWRSGGWASLVVQWLGSVLSLPGARVQALVGVHGVARERGGGFPGGGGRSAIGSAPSLEIRVHPRLLTGAAWSRSDSAGRTLHPQLLGPQEESLAFCCLPFFADLRIQDTGPLT